MHLNLFSNSSGSRMCSLQACSVDTPGLERWDKIVAALLQILCCAAINCTHD
jgi:hypothetical protein